MAIAAATPVLAAVPVIAQGVSGVYAKTARLAFKACGAEARDDWLIAGAIFSNLTDRGERQACNEDARDEDADFREFCKDQRDARPEVCDLVGSGRYDLDFDPYTFDLGGDS